MDYLDTVKLKRSQQRVKQQTLREKTKQTLRSFENTEAIVGAVKSGQEESNKHRETTTLKVNVQNPEVAVTNLPDLALRNDIQRLTEAIESLKTELKPESVEFAPVIKGLSELGTKLDRLPKQLPKAPEQLDSLSITNLSEIKDYFEPLIKAVNSIQVTPKVTVQPTPISLKGVETAIAGLKEEETEEPLVFSDFVGQDIDSENPGVQYIGLTHMTKDLWCVVENYLERESLRFCIGEGVYQDAWKRHIELDFKRWDEAVNAL